MAGSLESSRTKTAWIFLTPMLVVMLSVAAWPLLRTIWFGFTDAPLDDMGSGVFVGWRNYYEYFEGDRYGLLFDPLWWTSVKNTFFFAFVTVSLETVMGMVVALVLTATFIGRPLVRAAVLVPWAIPTIVSAKMWAWMLHDQLGIINDMLLKIGIVAEPVAWIANPDTALWAAIFVDVWKTTPFMALLLLAGLQTIPRDIYEAAEIDGVSKIKVFFRVTLPLVYPALVVAVVFRTLDALRVFDLIYVLTPNSEETITMAIFARQELVDFSKAGYGSAASTLVFFVIGLFIILYMRISRVRLNQ